MNTILLVDDDQELRFIVSKALRVGGYEPIEAGDGLSGLQIARTRSVDLILSDADMPLMSGTEFLQTLRSDPSTAAIPFVMMTGYTGVVTSREAMLMGADDYLTKPFTTTQLLDVVRIRLGRYEQIQGLAEAKIAQLRVFLESALPHELITPLSGIIGLSNAMIAAHARLKPSEVLEMATGIRDCGARLLRLTRNLLFVVDLDRYQSDPSAFESLRGAHTPGAKQVILEVARATAALCSRAGDLECDLMDVPVAISEPFLKRLVDELVDNAFKFSKPGNKVTISSRSDASHFLFSVHDWGRGMSPEQIGQVDAFQQFDRKGFQQPGLGLGLTIVKRLAQLHGGSFSVQSQPAEGTTVRVSLPV